jgi:UDP-N-acetylglucosamine acyltransferase
MQVLPKGVLFMPIAQSARIHPTAVIDPEATIGEDVQVGPFVVIEGPVHVGPGCVLKPGAHLVGPLTMGAGNHVYQHAVLGEQPQHLKFAGEATRLEIGDHNIFREQVTVHRGTTASWVTRIGSHNFLMANSHVAHDCIVGDRCILANGALLAGHCTLGDGACLSGNVAVHQFVHIGRLALLSGLSATGMDIPPFMIHQRINTICGVNVIGMRRAGISHAAIDAVRKAFHLLYRSDTLLSSSLPRIEHELGHFPEVAELLDFIRTSKSNGRGISLDYKREAA